MCPYSNVIVFQCARIPMRSYFNVLVVPCGRIPMCSYSNALVFQCARIPMCSYSKHTQCLTMCMTSMVLPTLFDTGNAKGHLGLKVRCNVFYVLANPTSGKLSSSSGCIGIVHICWNSSGRRLSMWKHSPPLLMLVPFSNPPMPLDPRCRLKQNPRGRVDSSLLGEAFLNWSSAAIGTA